MLLQGAGQFPVATPTGAGGAVVAFRGRGAHVSLDGQVSFALLDSSGQMSAVQNPASLDSPLDDRSPAIIALSPTRWLLLYSELNPGGPNGTFDVARARYRLRATQTLDGGATWTPPSTPNLPSIDSMLTIPYGRMQLLGDGQVLAAVYTAVDSFSNYLSVRPVLLATKDGGTTWRVQATLPNQNTETAVLAVGRDTLIAAMRSGANFLVMTASPDRGRTWTPYFQVTQKDQVPGDLAKLANGDLLLVYGSRVLGAKGIYYRRIRRQGLRLTLGPASVAAPITLGGVDLGYPSVIASQSNGRVSAVYYISGPDVPGTTQMRMVVFCPLGSAS